MSFTAADSNMIHICIYIFTINHFSRYIKKTKNDLRTWLFLLLSGPETSPLRRRLSSVIIRKSGGCWDATMTNKLRSKNVEILSVFLEERVPSSSRFPPSAGWFFPRELSRGIEERKWPPTGSGWPISRSSMPFTSPPQFRSFPFQSGGLIPVGTEWFHPTDCP